MKNNAFITTIFFIAAIIAFGCNKKSGNPGPGKKTPTTPVDSVNDVGADVYIVGISNGTYPNNAPYATLWKNGTQMLLPNGASNLDSEADGIALKGNDIYVVGSVHINSYEVAVMWKNGIFQQIGPNGAESQAFAVTTSGNDIVAAGRYTANNGAVQACYWKNGQLDTVVVVPDGGSAANAVAINGSDVYLAGYILDFSKKYYQAAYWKNGEINILSNDPNGSTAFGIVVSGTDIYVAGVTGNNATVWKNGRATNLTNQPDFAQASAIAITGNNVFISGAINGAPVYWKNGAPVTLTGNTFLDNGAIGNAIALSGNNVFVAGGSDSRGYFTFWWDEKQIEFAPTNDGGGGIRGIAVVAK